MSDFSETPPRSILVFADDVSPAEFKGLTEQLIGFLAQRTERLSYVQNWSRSYPRLRTIIVPGKAEDLRQVIPVGTNRIIAIDDERISRTPRKIVERLRPRFVVDPLDATGVLRCKSNGGAGTRIVVLDSGFFADHPDFRARIPRPDIRTLTGEDPSLDSEHGTRSVGLAAGPEAPYDGQARYGVAYDADVIFGRVLQGFTIPDAALLDGLQLAIDEQATVVNMSLGIDVSRGEAYSVAFELVAQRVLNAGTLIVAAAGNDEAGRFDVPVNYPANCPSVLAVGAVDGNLGPYAESAVRINCDGEVDLVAPGFDIRSSAGPDLFYDQQSGTSAAAALVSGIAALWSKSQGLRGCALWNALVDNALPVTGGTRRNTGAGLVQAPPP